jgi:hypothetical protein
MLETILTIALLPFAVAGLVLTGCLIVGVVKAINKK